MSEPWLSADQIASHLGVTKDTVYAWIADKGDARSQGGGVSGSSRSAKSMSGCVRGGASSEAE